jgi:hypothetical protein
MQVQVRKFCDTCSHNGWKDADNEDDDWHYGEDIPDEVKHILQEARGEDECELGSNFNAGCRIYICAECKEFVEHIPWMEE